MSIPGGSGGSSSYIYWSENDEYITRWHTTTDEVTYGVFPGVDNIGALVAGADKLWANAYAHDAGFEVDLEMGNKVNWTIPSAPLQDNQSAYDTGGIFDPGTGKFWLQADYEPQADPWPEYSWVAFDADGTFTGGYCDDNLTHSGSEVAYGTSPAIVDGWIYRNSNVAVKIDRFNPATGAYEYVEMQRPGGLPMGLNVIGYHPSYGLIVHNTATGNFEGRDIEAWTWWDMADYGNHPGGTLATADFIWPGLAGMNGTSGWGNYFVNDGAIYCVVAEGEYDVDYGWTGTVDGVSPTAWGWKNSIKSIDMATGSVTTRLHIPHRWIDVSGTPTSENNAGWNPGYWSPFGFTGTPILSAAATSAPFRLFPRRDNRAIGGARNRRPNPARIHPRQQ